MIKSIFLLRSILIALGRSFINVIENLGSISSLLLQIITAVFSKWPSKKIIINQMYRIGNQSIIVILTTGIFTGMVLSVQTHYMFKKVQMESIIGAVVSKSILLELGPVLAALILSGRIGASIAAEMGTMKVTEQIDAMKILSANPIKYLVMPRFLACVLLTPLLTAISDLIGVIGGYAISVYALHLPKYYYYSNTIKYTEMWDFFSGLIKAAFFGGAIALICCYKGMKTEGGAEGVGTTTTQAVVDSCIAILMLDFFLTLILNWIA